MAQSAVSGMDGLERMDRNRLGILLFIMSEALFFVALIVTYVVYSGRSTSGPSAKSALDVGTTAIFTVLLLSSSVSMGLASRQLGRKDVAGVRRWLLVTILLGAAFLLGQAREYVRLYQSGVTIAGNLWGSTFFTLTGFHGLHVLIGLIALGAVTLSIRQRGRDLAGESAVEVVGLYWHFVDAVWVAVFSVVYLWSALA